MLHLAGRVGAGDAFALAHARGRLDLEATLDRLAAAVTRPEPVLPVAGRDLLDLGLPRGPEVGRLLAELRDGWIASGVRTERRDLLARARAAVSGILSNS